MLYLVSTPIGNLGDFSPRAVQILRECVTIYCEDTRHSATLLHHYGIETPTRSYHKFSEVERENEVLAALSSGKQIALISDAGTPAIADPGERLVRAAIDAHLPVTAVPGPAAFLHALVLSGLKTTPFQFIGFLPKTGQQLKEALVEALHYPGTTIAYESPHRIEETVALLAKGAPQTRLVVARELTKKFEELLRGTAEQLLPQLQSLKGEMVLLIEGNPLLGDDSPQEVVKRLTESFALPKNEAIKIASKLLHLQKSSVYRLFL